MDEHFVVREYFSMQIWFFLFYTHFPYTFTVTPYLYGWLFAAIWVVFSLHDDVGMAGENSSKTGLTFAWGLPGVQRGGLFDCECIDLFLWSNLSLFWWVHISVSITVSAMMFKLYYRKAERLSSDTLDVQLWWYKVDMFLI